MTTAEHVVLIDQVSAGIIPTKAAPDQPDGLAEPALLGLDCTGRLVNEHGAVVVDAYRVCVAVPIAAAGILITAITECLTALAVDRPLVAYTREPYPTDPEPAS